MRLHSRDAFRAVHTEGGLLPADLLQRIAAGDRALDGLDPAAYHVDTRERLNEAIARSWSRLIDAWRIFEEARAALPADDAASGVTRERWLQVVFAELGYGRLVQRPAVEVDGRSFAVFSEWNDIPIHLVGAGVGLDARAHGVRGAAGQSPHSLVQELLNRSSVRLWGIVSNGLVLRLLRDNVTLTRQAYVEFDLEAIFTGELYADFVLMWLVCHESRVEAQRPEECWLERWSKIAAESGTRALDALRQGVEEAIETLGAGFLAYPGNTELHEHLRDGSLRAEDYYRTLLRLVYRLLFLFVAEDRGALLDPSGEPNAAERYAKHYSTAQLRELARCRRGGRHHDRYEQLKFVMDALHERGCPELALGALGSYLWDPAAIGPLATCRLANEDLFAAIRSLATVEATGVRRSVDFRNLGAEELGSVYESLLELHPELDRANAGFELRTVTGSERKTTGSYYTPSTLISSLLDTALEPVLDEAARSENPEQAILSLAVVDPACGSGHFLVAAANRIAKRLAAVRADDPEPAPTDVRAALREVVGSCIRGVDANPMAVELCKLSLWMEALEPGRPLSFLDHRIVLGNSLLGTTPELIAAGIPAAAFKPIHGDEKSAVTALRKRNEQERSGQMALDLASDNVDADTHAIAERAAAIGSVDDRSLAGVREQQQRFERLLNSDELRRAKLAGDVWCAAFVAEKSADAPAITEDVLARALRGGEDALRREELEVVQRALRSYSFLHWHVAFSDVWERGGFDVVLGNPPWEHTELKEREFFATLAPHIAQASTGAARKRMIEELATEDPALHGAFEAAKRQADGVSHFVRNSNRYPLCGRGRINTYAIFAELMRNAIGGDGRVGVILPTGIATDDTTKFFFQDIVSTRSIVSLYDFENRAGIFPAVDSRIKFCLLTLAGRLRPAETGARFVFFAHRVEDLDDVMRSFSLDAEDIELLNPNTRTCPVFRSRDDAELTKAIYRRVPVLVRDGDSEGNLWGVGFKQGLLNMTSDSNLFRTREQLEGLDCRLEGNVFSCGEERWLPLYEAKMLHQYDHRWATYERGTAGELGDAEKSDPGTLAMPRYWVPARSEVEGELSGWSHRWLLGWRRNARNTDERTLIANVIGGVSAGDSLFFMFPAGDPGLVAGLLAVLNSFVADFVFRQKVGGTNMSYYLLEQLPVVGPTTIAPVQAFFSPRVLELAYTAFDLAGFAVGLDYDGPPFRWDPERRALIRAELDAAMFRLYGIGRDDVGYIMETFPIVRRHDERRFGEYRTKRLILDRYDAMVEVDAAGRQYETPLDPPPGDRRAAHEPGSV